MTDLASLVIAGDIRAAARLMRDLDDRIPEAIEVLKRLYPHTGRAYIVGVTGNPGSGKSTAVDALISRYRARGGAILGDRIRMQRHALDDGVFIRSLATRGQLGGLSRSTFDVVSVLDAMGYERIIVETVGVGQDEIDVMRSAYTSVVITVPGLGDDIQAIKAGLLEIADVLVVNKSDREGSDRAVRDLMHMLDLRGGDATEHIEILNTIASKGTSADSGIAELVAAIERHRERTSIGEVGAQRARQRAANRVGQVVRGLLTDRAEAALAAHGGLQAVASAVAERERDPYTVAEEIVAAL